jgi:exonuclease III
VGTERRGTAILAKWEYSPQGLKRLPSGRGMAAEILNLSFINLYAHSGRKRRERERFFNHDILRLFPTTANRIVLAGDFNSVLSPNDCTGTPTISKTLNTLVTGMGLVNIWNTNQQTSAYTHYTVHGAARLDRIYITDVLRSQCGS